MKTPVSHYSIAGELEQLAKEAESAARAARKIVSGDFTHDEALSILSIVEQYLKFAKAHCNGAKRNLSK
jgi:hypothetical protein